METVKTVGVKNLKNDLSAYLREVKRGTRILVTDRNEVVAELREPLAVGPLTGGQSALEEWTHAGKIRLPRRLKGPLRKTGLCFAAGTALKLLDEGRRE